jgi:hypothetical protein
LGKTEKIISTLELIRKATMKGELDEIIMDACDKAAKARAKRP